jgi:CheY-like chemotaxis protein
VLLVEDDPGVRETAARILRGRGYHVLTAQSCEQALLVAAGHIDRIDLLLCDVVLGDGHGRDVVEALRTKGRKVPVIMMSGYSTEGLLPPGAVGEHALLHKPFHPDELAHAVRSALGDATALPGSADRAPSSSETDSGIVDG